jgi:hypothetical protein
VKHRVPHLGTGIWAGGEDGYSKLPLPVCMAWTHASGWDRVEIIDIPRGKGWEGSGTRFPLPSGELGRNRIPFVVSRRLVTAYAHDLSP